MKINLDDKYKKALRGRKHWIEIKEKYGITDEWGLVIMPDTSATIGSSGMNNIGFYLKKKRLKSVLVILSEDNDLSIENFADSGIYIEMMEGAHVEELLMYYKLNQFFRNIVVMSIDEPFGTNGIIGKCNIGIDEYVKDALYV